MKTNKILVATDFSEHGTAALQHATTLARQMEASLVIVHVRENVQPVDGYKGYIRDDVAAVHRLLAQTRPEDPSVPFSQRMLCGDPVQEIVGLAREEDAALIVMGTHGRTGLLRVLLGSVAEGVLRRAPCPVFTVKHAVGEDVPSAEMT